MEQFKENISSVEINLTEEIIAEIHTKYPNPKPYNQIINSKVTII